MEFPALLSLLVMLQFSYLKTATPKPINWYKLAAGNHFILNTFHINIIHICKSLLVVARDRTTENYHVNHLIFFQSTPLPSSCFKASSKNLAQHQTAKKPSYH